MILGQNPSNRILTISFQGEPGAFSNMALRALFGTAAQILPCQTFEEAFEAVTKGRADRAVIPDLNIIKGRPSEVPNLIRRYTARNFSQRLHVTDEYSQSVSMCAMMHENANLADAKVVISHPVALEQIQNWLSYYPHLEVLPVADTAGAAKFIAESQDSEIQRTYVAVSPPLAAETYPNMQVIERGIEDVEGNQTHFYTFSRKANKLTNLQKADGNIVSLFMLEASRRAFIDYALQTYFRNQRDSVSYSPLIDFFGGKNYTKTHMLFETAGHIGLKKTREALMKMKDDGVIAGYTPIGMHVAQSNKIFGRAHYRWH